MKKLFVILWILTTHAFSYSMVCYIDVELYKLVWIAARSESTSQCDCGITITTKEQFIEHIKDIQESQEKLPTVVVKKSAITPQGKNPKK